MRASWRSPVRCDASGAAAGEQSQEATQAAGRRRWGRGGRYGELLDESRVLLAEGLLELGEQSPLTLGESHLHSPGPQSVLTSVIRTTRDDNAAPEQAPSACGPGATLRAADRGRMCRLAQERLDVTPGAGPGWVRS